jgi:hypothetical protein
MCSPDAPPSSFERLSPQDAYTRFLALWKRASQEQVAALEDGEWERFDRALADKSALVADWQRHREEGALDAATVEVSPALGKRWAALTRDIQQLDRKIEAVLRILRDRVRQDMRQTERERRALQSYRAFPKNLAPRYLDKKM